MTDELARLRAENADLKEQLASFKRDVLGDCLVFPMAWRLTPQERRLLAVLLSRSFVAKDAALAAMKRYTGADIDAQQASVVICRLRSKLPDDLSIRTVWGDGWAIDEPARSLWRERLLPVRIFPARVVAA